MIGKIESVEKSKSGKSWRVKIGGNYYGAKFDSKLDKEVGSNINFSVEDTGNYGVWITSWAYDATKAPPAAETGKTGNGDRFYMPFVSNVVAHAIASGQIKTPADLNQWAKSAYDAAQALDGL